MELDTVSATVEAEELATGWVVADDEIVDDSGGAGSGGGTDELDASDDVASERNVLDGVADEASDVGEVSSVVLEESSTARCEAVKDGEDADVLGKDTGYTRNLGLKSGLTYEASEEDWPRLASVPDSELKCRRNDRSGKSRDEKDSRSPGGGLLTLGALTTESRRLGRRERPTRKGYWR